MIVADTNLLAYLYIRGAQTDSAERVLRSDRDWAAPMLWRSELRNVLTTQMRRNALAIQTALEIFSEAESIVGGREYVIETSHVLDLVRGSTCSAYDCEFVALAEELDVPLVTSDARILADFPGIAVTPSAFAT